VRALAALAPLALVACAETSSLQGAYAKAEARRLSMGLMREDDGNDVPFDQEYLARHFQRLAFYSGPPAASPSAFRPDDAFKLVKWRGAVRWSLRGDGVSDRDRADVAALFDRIARATGLTIEGRGGERADIAINIVTRRDRVWRSRWLGNRLIQTPLPDLDLWLASEHIPCMHMFRRSKSNSGYAVKIFMRDEASARLRRACPHEGIARSVGLLGPGRDVRPSIFNGDKEFALLTRHDELLLEILYDPRLSPGMTEAEAMPIVRRIAAELAL
jgi:hypothetical protein